MRLLATKKCQLKKREKNGSELTTSKHEALPQYDRRVNKHSDKLVPMVKKNISHSEWVTLTEELLIRALWTSTGETGCPKIVILAILAKVTSNVHRMYRNTSRVHILGFIFVVFSDWAVNSQPEVILRLGIRLHTRSHPPSRRVLCHRQCAYWTHVNYAAT